jgi:hypothetical protein
MSPRGIATRQAMSVTMTVADTRGHTPNFLSAPSSGFHSSPVRNPARETSSAAKKRRDSEKRMKTMAAVTRTENPPAAKTAATAARSRSAASGPRAWRGWIAASWWVRAFMSPGRSGGSRAGAAWWRCQCWKGSRS